MPPTFCLYTYPPGLLALQTGSFTAPRITVRPGLGSLPHLRDLRFRSAKRPLAFCPSAASPARGAAAGGGGSGGSSSLGGGAGAPLLPAQLIKLRLEGCHLTEASGWGGWAWEGGGCSP